MPEKRPRTKTGVNFNKEGGQYSRGELAGSKLLAGPGSGDFGSSSRSAREH